MRDSVRLEETGYASAGAGRGPWSCGSVRKRLLASAFFAMAFAAWADTYYVDANNGNDEWDGTVETADRETVDETKHGPCKTLARIVEIAKNSGDVIIALPGTYDKGLCDTDKLTHSRVCLPRGVTLQSSRGPERTFIVGARGTASRDALGNGTDAVRCIRFDSTGSGNAKVIGFTLCGGRTVNSEASGDSAEIYGGAASGRSSAIVDCIISNNAAIRGGAVSAMTCYRCRFYDNDAGYGSVSMGATSFYNCFVDNTGGSYACYLNQDISKSGKSYAYNTFFYSHGGGTGPRDITAAYNCVFVGNLQGGRSATAYTTFYHCWFTAEPKSQYAVLAPESGCRTDFSSFGQFGISTEGRIYADSIMIDKGDNSYIKTGDAAVDLRGKQRVSNATIDMGPSEYDWTGSYGKVLAEKRVNVTAASPYVVKKDDTTLTIPKGGTLELDWDCLPSERSFKAVVTGTGSLEVTLDGEHLATVTEASSGTVSFQPQPRGVHKLAFAYTGAGSADIGEFDNSCGLVLLFR